MAQARRQDEGGLAGERSPQVVVVDLATPVRRPVSAFCPPSLPSIRSPGCVSGLVPYSAIWKETRMEPLISIERVSKHYVLDHSSVTALEDVSLRIHRGEFLAIAGPSGSGKSTLLNLIGCIDSPSRGRILMDGAETTALRPAASAALRREKIGFVFQTFNLIPVFTAAENVEYPLLLQGVGASERGRRTGGEFRCVGLS